MYILCVLHGLENKQKPTRAKTKHKETRARKEQCLFGVTTTTDNRSEPNLGLGEAYTTTVGMRAGSSVCLSLGHSGSGHWHHKNRSRPGCWPEGTVPGSSPDAQDHTKNLYAPRPLPCKHWKSHLAADTRTHTHTHTHRRPPPRSTLTLLAELTATYWSWMLWLLCQDLTLTTSTFNAFVLDVPSHMWSLRIYMVPVPLDGWL